MYMYVWLFIHLFWNVGTYNSFMLTHFPQLTWELRCRLCLNKFRTGPGRHCDCAVQLSRGRMMLGYFFHAVQDAGLLNVLRLAFLTLNKCDSDFDSFQVIGDKHYLLHISIRITLAIFCGLVFIYIFTSFVGKICFLTSIAST